MASSKRKRSSAIFSVTLAVVTAGLMLVPTRANATPTFPLAISDFAMGPTPACSACHVGPQQRGTVNTAFGFAMRSRGLVAFDEGSLMRALEALDRERTDSDEDGVSDVDELRAGTNPNALPGEDSATIVPMYGCAAAPNGKGDWTLVFLGCLAAVKRRRRARG